MGGDELARHLDDGRQVEHDGVELRVELGGDDAVAAGAAASGGDLQCLLGGHQLGRVRGQADFFRPQHELTAGLPL